MARLHSRLTSLRRKRQLLRRHQIPYPDAKSVFWQTGSMKRSFATRPGYDGLDGWCEALRLQPPMRDFGLIGARVSYEVHCDFLGASWQRRLIHSLRHMPCAR
jgi:hypothetical protein